jgi:hypothetical protein
VVEHEPLVFISTEWAAQQFTVQQNWAPPREVLMKIGKLEFKRHAANKPLGVSPTGEFLKAKDLVGVPSLALGSLHALQPDVKLTLAVARYKLEPDFRLGIIGHGVLSRDEIIEHMEKQTDFGQLAVNVEMDYCNYLIATLGSGERAPAWPKPLKPVAKPIPDWKPVKKCVLMKVATQALFCENTTDSVTSPFAAYRIANVHPAFAARGFAVKVLSGHDDTRTNFVPPAKDARTVYISGIGHGSYTTYTGDAFNVILQVCGYDPAEVKGKGIHFLSCETAGQLGPDAVSKGARCYLGYSENFTFVWDDPNTHNIDEVLLFKKADSIIDITMANGGTAQQAYDAAVQSFNAGMGQVPGTAAASWLKYDRDHLKLLGDVATTIPPYRLVKICFPLSATKAQALALAGELVDA